MKRFSVLLVMMALLGALVGCSGTGPSASSTTVATPSSELDASSWPITPIPTAVAGAGSSDTASSDRASSDAASSDAASSDAASSNVASSSRVSSGASSGIASSAASGISEMNVSMQYISGTDLLAAINKGDKNKLIVDLRKPADVKAGFIQGAIFAPMNGAVDNSNYIDAIANLTGALYDATGNEVGEGKELVLVCYQGKKYAQAATDILNALGADMSKVYTLEGGMAAWNKAGNPTVTR